MQCISVKNSSPAFLAQSSIPVLRVPSQKKVFKRKACKGNFAVENVLLRRHTKKGMQGSLICITCEQLDLNPRSVAYIRLRRNKAETKTRKQDRDENKVDK